ncbi:MAG: Chk1 protein kinase [Chrysothrix sp. TS-e1954]|nr:MAG: Chk1 protein kinase [Chrysothrix sp. TS-e1954]
MDLQVEAQPFPSDLPFRVISRTIGQGAYAFIRKACPKNAFQPVIAVKFIHKRHAFQLGRVNPKQIATEVALHGHVGRHQNIIEFIATGEDSTWTWIAMELAEGDLFDKIEADVGVPEDVAHLYFSQLISAVSYMHSRNVAHRDIKPENVLLSNGNLKLADFGLSTLYGYNGNRKKCQTVCGSRPYMAPEIVPRGGFTGRKAEPYDPNIADVWSSGVVLFVLLVGNTPWDEPTSDSEEFRQYQQGDMSDELWTKLPLEVRSLLRGILKVDPSSRMALENVRRHPWFARQNPHLSPDGRAVDTVGLATKMLSNLRIDFKKDPLALPNKAFSRSVISMDDSTVARMSLTQPETPVGDGHIDWERPAWIKAKEGVSASQPLGREQSALALDRFADDPIQSQFSSTPAISLSLTQNARTFNDLVPAHTMARFLSYMDFHLLLPLITEALSRLAVPVPSQANGSSMARERKAFIPIKTKDQRGCLLVGTVTVDKLDEEIFEVRFLKATGDPLEWRRLFKKITILCEEAVIKPEV